MVASCANEENSNKYDESAKNAVFLELWLMVKLLFTIRLQLIWLRAVYIINEVDENCVLISFWHSKSISFQRVENVFQPIHTNIQICSERVSIT